MSGIWNRAAPSIMDTVRSDVGVDAYIKERIPSLFMYSNTSQLQINAAFAGIPNYPNGSISPSTDVVPVTTYMNVWYTSKAAVVNSHRQATVRPKVVT